MLGKEMVGLCGLDATDPQEGEERQDLKLVEQGRDLRKRDRILNLYSKNEI
jgi:hypothetical protein